MPRNMHQPMVDIGIQHCQHQQRQRVVMEKSSKRVRSQGLHECIEVYGAPLKLRFTWVTHKLADNLYQMSNVSMSHG